MDEQTIFTAALELGSAERAAFLDEACQTNTRLRERVEELLRLHDNAGDFLEQPAAGAVSLLDLPPITEKPGTLIGPYELLEQIGEGGMGLVFMARQREPVKRNVALKLIKPGMDTRQVIARFEAERQALALMDHPNIARVLDAGSTESGRPYFVMDLVKGIPITEYCDQKRLSNRQRLGLFVSVCQAVQHAHQKGIIHRDLKPTNILVTLRDGAPVAKIIDFGIAKAAKGRLTEETLVTNFAQVLGTPLYMAPEQAEISELDVDTRTDIYSLGVLLYELLTGTTPFEQEKFKDVSFGELRRIIREEEPPRPSSRISTLGDSAVTVAENRHIDSRTLSQQLHGELDWIVMKALEKDRTRRYETAHGLGRDIERHLSDEPVLARPPSTRYRLVKYVRRHRVATAAAVALVASLTLGLIGTTVGFVRANAERQTALRERAQALRERTKAQRQRDRAIAAVQLARGQTDDLLYQAADYRIYASDNSREELKFRPVPLLEWDCGSDMGADDGQFGSAFVWLHGKRPAVIGAIHRSEWEGTLVNWHELCSVAQGPLIADYRGLQVWTPPQAAILFTPFRNATSPAETLESRLSQMRDLASQFAVSNQTGRGWSSLRLKLEPLYRYGSRGTDLIDGALFAFLDFTDPELVLLLEARRIGSTTRWYYSLAELSWWPLKVHHQGKVIWERLAPDLPGWSNILEVGDYRSRSSLTYSPTAIPAIRKGESLRKLAQVYEQYGLTLWESGEPQAAQVAAAEARKLWQQLERDFGRSLGVRFQQAQMYLQHAQTHRRAGRVDEEEKAAIKVVKLCEQLASDFPNDYRLCGVLGFAHAVLGHWDQAAQAGLEAVQLTADPAQRCRCFIGLAQVQASAGDLQACRATCQKLLTEFGNTKDPEIAIYLGDVYLWIPHAISDPDRVVELVELSSSAQLRRSHEVKLAIALYRAGRYQEAADRLERQLTKLNPDKKTFCRVIGRIALSMVRYQLGDTRQARGELHEALELIDQADTDHAGKPVTCRDRMLWYERWKLDALRREAEELLGVTLENTKHE